MRWYHRLIIASGVGYPASGDVWDAGLYYLDFKPPRKRLPGSIERTPYRCLGGAEIRRWDDQFVSLGQPRWVIPGRVVPQVSGDATGAEYYYFDQVTGRKEGPYKPTQ